MVLKIISDSGEQKATEVVRMSMSLQTDVVLGQNMVVDLQAELRDMRQVLLFLLDLAAQHDKPIGIHFDAPKSQTVFVSPPGWSSEKLEGYVAAKRDSITSAFGDITMWQPST